MNLARITLTDAELDRINDANCALALVNVLEQALIDADNDKPWSEFEIGAIVAGLKTAQHQMLVLTERIVMDGYKQLDESKAGGRDDG